MGEGLLVEAHAAIGCFDDGELIVGVVDGEGFGEAGADGPERIAIAAEEADAEGVEGGELGAGGEFVTVEEIADAVAHFAGGLIGEGDGEDGKRGDVLRGDEVRDALGDDLGLAASRAGEDEDGTIGGFYRFELLGVQTFEEIH